MVVNHRSAELLHEEKKALLPSSFFSCQKEPTLVSTSSSLLPEAPIPLWLLWDYLELLQNVLPGTLAVSLLKLDWGVHLHMVTRPFHSCMPSLKM